MSFSPALFAGTVIAPKELEAIFAHTSKRKTACRLSSSHLIGAKVAKA
jgi:hypothetical protein